MVVVCLRIVAAWGWGGGEAGLSFVDWDFGLLRERISSGLGISIGLGPAFIFLFIELVMGASACLLGRGTDPAFSVF